MKITYNYKIPQELENITIREYFNFYHLSKTKINSILDIKINDSKCSIEKIIKKDDVLSLTYEDEIDVPLDDKLIDIIYEDDYILVLNKPVNLLIHPDSKEKNNTLVNRVANYYKNTNQNISVRYAHRLDFETTGLIIFTKDIISASYINYLISIHEISRIYLAIASGLIKPDKGVIDKPIGEDRHHNQRRRVSQTGQKAITHYEVINYIKNKYSFVKLELKTGRTHQIRVHMKYLGFPLLGDQLYGGSIKTIKRVCLHSFKLSFKHPISFKKLELEAILPKDLERIVKDV
ncbi:MAG: RluA family pseudouridine synthase [Anaeroplasmataceae bacterium]